MVTAWTGKRVAAFMFPFKRDAAGKDEAWERVEVREQNERLSQLGNGPIVLLTPRQFLHQSVTLQSFTATYIAITVLLTDTCTISA